MKTTTNNKRMIQLTSTQKPFLERNENLCRYYADIRNYDTLSEEEIRSLFIERETATPQRKDEIKNCLFEHNARLAISMARKYCTGRDNLNDLIEEANIGLLHAIDAFDVRKGSTFSSCALQYIRREINEFKGDYGDIVYKTNHLKTDGSAKKISSEFFQKEGRLPTTEELLEIYNNTRKTPNKKIVNHSDLNSVEYVYIDSLEGKGEDFTDCQSYLDYTSKTASANDYCREMESDHNHETLITLMKNLKPAERNALRLMYGLETGFEESLSSIGMKLGCTSERARQLCLSGIEKMQKQVACKY